MSSPSARNPQVPQTTGDTQHNVPNAALRGASLAFSKPPVKPKPLVNTYTGSGNGALLAATKVGTGTPRASTPQGTPSPLRRDWTGGSHAGRPNVSPMQVVSKSSSSSTLDVPVDFLSDRTTSPSNIAAKLAAARYSPMKPIPQAAAMPITSEREANEGDVLPPAGSVGNMLAKIKSRNEEEQQPPPIKRVGSAVSHSIAKPVRLPQREVPNVDDTPIPPTTSLANMFEQHRPTTPVNRVLEPVIVSRTAPPPIRSPKPQRSFKPPPEPKEIEVQATKPAPITPPVKPKPKPKVQREPALSTDGAKEEMVPISFQNIRRDTLGKTPGSQKPAQLQAVRAAAARPKPPVHRESKPKSTDLTLSTTNRRRLSSLDSVDNMSSPSSYASAPETQDVERSKPSLPPPRRSGKTRSATAVVRPKTATQPPPRSLATSKVTSPTRPPEMFPPPRPASATGMRGSPPSGSLYHSNYQRESVKAITKHMTGESLSSAIMGAALASSRNASPAPPSTTNPPLLPARKQHHHSPFHITRSPSPPKPQSAGKMRTTLRKELSSSDDEGESDRYKRKGTRIMGVRRKHPNKHHEGDRKRWRDTVTERERKRYEGVWAANKGLYVPPPARSQSRVPFEDDPAADVLNIVTKEIWLRSRLPEDALEEVWNLVDGRGNGRLRREEFVVGMWLIDQTLKGRKLPPRVSESVWGSVKGVGVKVKVHK
ncbi:hypothetical protein BDV96DRAFT_626815 [Lophiotrema nucula]|uniref:EH domain-containing protein n=1 Tax=Lophiotrema nucula TaxID=690887 RepID=A0A6A5ZVG9_9PLEO|nr:hypothetical protein BDV96DRAFT_626815 [Lophiotrema nucula]